MTHAKIALPVLVLIGAAAPARAQSADAETLFQQGRALVKQGKLAAGCDKLAASARIDPSVGTLLNVGDCREREGKLASAWAAFEKARSLAKQTAHDEQREHEAARRAAKLAPQLATLTIAVADSSDGLVIRRDHEPIDRALWSTPAPVDPGSYSITAEAPGHKTWHSTVVVASRAHAQIVVPVLEAEPPPPVAAAPLPAPAPARAIEPAPAPVSAPAPIPAPPPRFIHERATWSTARRGAVALGIGGAAALGVGVYFGLRANDLQHQADARCPSATCSDPLALRLNSDAQTDATRADVLYAAGGLGIAVATILWFAGRPDETTVVVPAVGGGQVGATLERRF